MGGTEDLQKSRLRTRSINEKTPKIGAKTSVETADCLNWSSNNSSKSPRTPKTSRRKKFTSSPTRTLRRRSLFQKEETNENFGIGFDGIAPLMPISVSNNRKVLRSSINKPFEENNMNYIPSSSIKKKNIDCRTAGTEELQKLFNNVNIRAMEKSVSSNSDEESVYSNKKNINKRKRHLKRVPKLLDVNLKSKSGLKVRRLEEQISEDLQISTKTFYSNQNNESSSKIEMENSLIPLNMSPTVLKMVPQSSELKTYYKTKKAKPQRSNAINPGRLANKGVGHGVRRKFFKNKNEKSIKEFLKTIKCEKLKCLPSKRISPEQVRQVHNIFKTTANSIELAKPLVINCENEIFSQFSDSDESEIDNFQVNKIMYAEKSKVVSSHLNSSLQKQNNTIQENESVSQSKSKKFFKSGHSSFKEIKITENIKLGISCGKMSLLTEKKKKPKGISKTFLNEQAMVNEIIKNLNISPEKKECSDIENIAEKLPSGNQLPDIVNQQVLSKVDDEVSINYIHRNQDDPHKKFRDQIPYRTTDSNEIERQNLLLDFLISNNICTEKNFEIFIANPDRHKIEADEIINNIVEVVKEDTHPCKENLNLDPFDHFRNQIPYNTSDPTKAKEQGILLDFLIENNICTEENFTIFIKELETRKDEAEKIIESVSGLMQIEQNEELSKEVDVQPPKQVDLAKYDPQPLYPIFYSGKRYMPVESKFLRSKKLTKLWRASLGMDQYQIDAGQKEFGAKQCEKCALVYTVHEPEEEKLHKEYHDSIYFSKFKGWIDEDVVERYFEWSNDGRIIRVTSCEHSKKKERLMNLLKIVDKELGFASYILPDTYVAFLAVRKSQFVGLCLVQFLNKANRYVKINGVDCCTEEFFDVKIGISRIWVSPLCRRMGIASKLLLAARSYALLDDVVDIDDIAFSAPTEDGKVFAQKISKRTDFLLYQ